MNFSHAHAFTCEAEIKKITQEVLGTENRLPVPAEIKFCCLNIYGKGGEKTHGGKHNVQQFV